MIIINSSAYVASDFQVEFGKIPPCMLPIGNKKLIEHQVLQIIASFGNVEIYLTLPDDYSLNYYEIKLIERLNLNLVLIPQGFSLAESILFVLNVFGDKAQGVRLLHGDTYIEKFPTETDIISTSKTDIDYSWEIVNVSNRFETVWCGFFSFSQKQVLIKSLALSKGDFVSAVKKYGDEVALASMPCNNWLDLGHVNTYYSSRSKITTQRHFNSLQIKNGVLTKSSTKTSKILAEANWFKSTPTNLKRFLPQLIDSGNIKTHSFYSLEYLPCAPLNEIYVHGKNPIFFWDSVASLIVEFFLEAQSLPANFQGKAVDESSKSLFFDKTFKRLAEYATLSNVSITDKNILNGQTLPSLLQIAEEAASVVLSSPCIPAVLHGDPCFSNILYDSRSRAIKLIDPRGIDAHDNLTIYGDQRYDLAKVLHSSYGFYDFIVAGCYTLKMIGKNNFDFELFLDKKTLETSEVFSRAITGGLSCDLSIHSVILLFLSMLPLHSDSSARQSAFIANALRLYSSI